MSFLDSLRRALQNLTASLLRFRRSGGLSSKSGQSSSSSASRVPLIIVWGPGPGHADEYEGIPIGQKRVQLKTVIQAAFDASGVPASVRFSEDSDVSVSAGRLGLPRRK